MNSGMSNWEQKVSDHLSSCQDQALLTRHFFVLGLINGSKNIQSYCFAQQVLGTKSIRPPTNCIPAKLRRCRQNGAPRKQLNHFTPSEPSSMPSIQFFRSFCDICDIHDPAKDFFTDWNLDRYSSVLHQMPSLEPLCGSHRNGPDGVAAQVLRDFKHQARLPTDHFQSIENFGKATIKLHINHCAMNRRDFARTHVLCCQGHHEERHQQYDQG